MLPHSLVLSSEPVFMLVLAEPVKKGKKKKKDCTGSKRQGGKTDHSNVRGLWTSQMHSERPLIKIISTGDGQRE